MANAHFYKAAVTQKKTMGQAFRDLMNQSFDGEAGQMIVAMLENNDLSPQDLDEIEAMIEAKRKSRAGDV